MAMGVRINFVTIVPSIFILSLALHLCVTAIQTITPTQYISDPETITSSGGSFKLGFFSPSNSTNRYIGIWYNNITIQTIVWVANRENPITDSPGIFKIGDDGNLVVLDGGNKVLWSTNVSDISYNSSTTAVLNEYGNLILRELNSTGRKLWQSFEHPTHTIIPGMSMGNNKRTGEKRVITAWKSGSDPSHGRFFSELDTSSIPQVINWNGSVRHWRSGPWNGMIFIGVQNMYSAINYVDMSALYNDGFTIDRNDTEGSVYLTLSIANKYPIVRYVLNYNGKLNEYGWYEGNTKWDQFFEGPVTECEFYGKCGAFGSCNVAKSPICSCLNGFEPKLMEEWSKGNWSGGCVRKTQLQCVRNNTNGEVVNSDGFLKMEKIKVPDFENLWASPKDLKGCEQECLNNCSCLAYSYVDNIGCMWWNGNLIDIEKFSKDGVDLYIRVAHSELSNYLGNKDKKNVKVIIIITVVIGMVVIVGVGVCTYLYCKRRRTKQRRNKTSAEFADSNMLGDNPDLQIFNFEMISIATSNFDDGNKLGQGGFGPVFKGTLPNGQEIAVKRLSTSSGQGVEEFKNEVVVISKLQHRNLVRLLGCCIEGDEKMLIYEFLPNKSLDSFIFDPTKQALLDWKKRLKIIEGIGRGILYLHRDSRLRVIHRDLKASNILLDENLNPKISDFGMARIFGGNELQANTRRVVGTYGYMSPEYAMDGLFSEKSDVFSFGVLLLEIVSGKRNSSFQNHESWSLLGYTWKLWNEGEVVALIDSTLSEPSFTEEILKCIHVGLLCVQDFAKDRPSVSTIISMLTSEITNLPTPKQPAFTERQIVSGSYSSLDSNKACSINNVTITCCEGR